MAESDAVRSRRKRLHAAGDHSMCLVGRCLAATKRAIPNPDLDDITAGLGQTARAAVEMIACLSYQPGDPRWLISVTTIRLAKVFDKAPTPAIASEIRRNVTWLTTEENQPADALDEIRAGVVRDKAELLIKHALALVPEGV